MNKQQLATKIWESANRMRSKIEANEYKDYILGFIFYKYLSDKEVKFLKKAGFAYEDIVALTEDDAEVVQYVRDNVGYFIAYKDLFSTWLTKGRDFDVSDVSDALSAFNRLINPLHAKVFEGIFNTLQTGLTKLGDSAASRTKAISELIHLIQDIPMDGKQDYDVLGFIYEYLIGMFAANAGKKAGEFYTPHEVSLLMSEIVAYHLKDRTEIKIYDPTSGSGSLLINIGRAVKKHLEGRDTIQYYAQELKQNTYNLTRMNLVMRGILPDNIVTRNGDTLEQDWPLFDEANPVETYAPLYVDAVVSNPPYSQQWDPDHKESDPRYAPFGLAPKSKADYAFLLHELFHLKPDGIMTIVLPHGVLFRGGEEGTIRKHLIEGNYIDAVIGLPANIFFGTGIPTIIMVLKQKREHTDVLIVDASKGFIKVGKNNQLRASDIKQIVDTITARADIDKFSRKVSREEIRRNDYNLNLPRYVDSSDAAEPWDLHALMFGGIPLRELAELNDYWAAFPGLQATLFTQGSGPYAEQAVEDVAQAVEGHPAVHTYLAQFREAFQDFDGFLKDTLITHMTSLQVSKAEEIVSADIFARLASVPLINRYAAYQILDDQWTTISVDLEIIQTEGFSAVKNVDPNLIIKEKDGKEDEVQDGWIGHVIPFELVQRTLLSDAYEALRQKEARLAAIAAEYDALLDSLSEEDRNSPVTNESNDAFVPRAVAEALQAVYAEVSTPEITALNAYTALTRKAEKLTFIHTHPEVLWSHMELGRDGTYTKPAVKAYVAELQSAFTFPDESLEAILAKVSQLMTEEKDINAQVKADTAALHKKTKDTLESLSDEQALALLEHKWIGALTERIQQLPHAVLRALVDKITTLSDKYAVTYSAVEQEIQETASTLSGLLDELTGNEYDKKGLSAFRALLKGE